MAYGNQLAPAQPVGKRADNFYCDFQSDGCWCLTRQWLGPCQLFWWMWRWFEWVRLVFFQTDSLLFGIEQSLLLKWDFFFFLLFIAACLELIVFQQWCTQSEKHGVWRKQSTAASIPPRLNAGLNNYSRYYQNCNEAKCAQITDKACSSWCENCVKTADKQRVRNVLSLTPRWDWDNLLTTSPTT